MSSVSVRLDDETDQLIQRLKDMSDIDKAGMMNAIAEGLRDIYIRKIPDGRKPGRKKWKRSIRAEKSGGKTLTKTKQLGTSIHAQSDSTGLAVGTNVIYAATHQFGDERTIRAKKGQEPEVPDWRQMDQQATGKCVKIPAREFLGISEQDDMDIQEMLKELFEE